MEQPRRRVMRGEVPAEHLGHLPHLAAMCEVDLEQAVARDHIALPEKASALVAARIWGTPHRSSTMVIGCDSPGTVA